MGRKERNQNSGVACYCKSYTYHANIKSGGNVDWGIGGCIGDGSDDGRQKTHNAITGDSDTVPRSAVGRRQDFRRVSIERAVVDVNREVDGAGETEVFSRGADSCVGEKEGHSCQRADNHCVPAA